MFWAADIKVVEGYGLTETSPVVAANHYSYPDICFGTVGPVLTNAQVKIADDGEILCKGPAVMPGYYKDPELTAEVIDSDGWFHTGDIGIFVDDRFLKITDRKKEMFKTSGGKYIAPQVIENKCKESIFIEQILVVGENEKFAAAIISPNFNYLHFWALKHKIHYRDNAELISKPAVINRIQREINQINKTLSPHEQIKRFRLVKDEWTPATGELSPTLKLKRRILYSRYENLMKDMYSYQENEENRAIKDRK
jgi:long-chain acyl-CoA synthetase